MNGEKKTTFSKVDQAVSQRLAQLRSMPVDTTRLAEMLEREIPRPRRTWATVWRLPLMRTAAAVVLVAALAVSGVLMFSGRPAVASPTDMAQLHDDLISGRIAVSKVDSMAQANAELLKQWADSPTVPNVPNEHVMACCMHSVKNKRMACVLLKGDDQLVTLTVANAADVKLPSAPPVVRNGVSYYVQTTRSLNMVMTQRQGRCVCLIGQLSMDRLMDLASRMEL